MALDKFKCITDWFVLIFLILIILVFIILKLTNIINWSWWIVLIPIYGTIAIGILILIFITYLLLHKELLSKR